MTGCWFVCGQKIGVMPVRCSAFFAALLHQGCADVILGHVGCIIGRKLHLRQVLLVLQYSKSLPS